MTRQETVDVAARLLETAAGLVALGWTTNANARLADGTPCSPEQPAAACWCAQGALTAAQHLMGIHTQRDGGQDIHLAGPVYNERASILDKARNALRDAIREGLHPSSLAAVSVTLCITNWNDDEADGGDVVARTMRRAAELLRAAAPPAPRSCRHCHGMGCVRCHGARRQRCDRCAGTGPRAACAGGAHHAGARLRYRGGA